jgi:four helix bundle protein
VVSDFRDLVCWQLSYEPKCEVFAFTSTGKAARDSKYRDQILDSSASTPGNIAEGFGRFRARDSAFYEIARAATKATTNLMLSKQRQARRSDSRRR